MKLALTPILAAVVLVAGTSIGHASSTRTDAATPAQAAYEQRLKCAAYYRLSLDIAHKGQPSAARQRVITTYSAVGQNMLIQASALATQTGATADELRAAFKKNLTLLRSQALEKPSVYNAISRRMHGVCQRLIVR
jgi:hypothetical protein